MGFLRTLLLGLLATSLACSPQVQNPPATPTPVQTTSVEVTPPPVSVEQPAPVERGETEVTVPTLGSGKLSLAASLEALTGDELSQLKGTEFEEPIRKLVAARADQSYKYEKFQAFLPQGPVRVGDVWTLPEGACSQFLKQIHPEMVEKLERDGTGAYAVLRAQSDSHLEILLRVHAQFWLSEGKMSVSPGQFEGRLVLNRSEWSVEYFSLSVPTTYAKNVNYESRGEGDYLVGMVFAPDMGLEGGNRAALESTPWKERLELDFARRQLAQKFFAFEKLKWVPMDQVVERAEQEKKLIFAIVIEGVLNDQSC